ncbi:MAG: ATP-dependent DNA helicase RecG [Candidatus Yanofskybacteria bacterium RIFCSPHIGHO2_01_FULL_39_44]|nr:MAG: ATP-dependent DNA helicase RecG [Candidatus Yanofskybacteria bacterium RIFCSPHIGHO2_01_FULL_39_44]
MQLNLPIDKLRNVGPRNLSRLHKLGIKTIKDLLWHFPVRYEDYTETMSISEIQPGDRVNVQGEVLKISSKRLFPRRLTITNAIVGDSSGAIKVVWFNQPYIENQLTEGNFVSLAGKASLNKHGLYLSSPTYEKGGLVLKHTSGLVPVYPETEGVTSKYLRFLIKPLLKNIKVSDLLPSSVLSKYNLPEISKALATIHYPSDLKEAGAAKERFAFEDLLLFQIKALLERRKLNQLKSISVPFDQELIQGFIASLPFELTTDQKVATWEILKDIQKSYPMNRLMEGDVGSGKTVVALIAAYQIAKQGHQVVFMVPTEVLAQQHYKTAALLIKDSGVNMALLIGSEAKFNNESVTKKLLKEKIYSGEVKIIIGTHAVIQKDVVFNKLAMVVIDEQHRFGINQRAALVKNSELVPHLLSMTATPIPRTLALTIYGDLDISLIKEKPKNRQKIITKVSTPTQKNEAYQFIRDEVKNGRQVFVVCPRIEISDPKKEIKTGTKQSKMNVLWADVKAVEEEYKKLSQEIFPDLKVAMLHGKLKPKDKNEIMSSFSKASEDKDKRIDILVSTSVIEVGVDVPNATIMAIESAERFGLAQLHQFRGRVGRGEHQSYCLLFSSTGDKSINQRLKALVECDDGFELAEKDMKIRGPGEFFGVKQSGLPDLGMASLANIDLIKKARAEARLLLKEDPSLTNYPLLKDRLESFQKLTHFE